MKTTVVTETHASAVCVEGSLSFEPIGDHGIITIDGSVSAASINIKAGWSIKAGGSIEAGGYVFSFTFSIVCKWFSTKRLPFWREFYAAMPPLKKWSQAIRDEGKCWNQLCTKISSEEAVEVCAWDGWHPLIRAQLEMFFRLKDKHVMGTKDDA